MCLFGETSVTLTIANTPSVCTWVHLDQGTIKRYTSEISASSFFSSLLDKFILLGKRKFTLFIFFILLCTHHHVKHILLLILILVTRFILLSWNERQTETGWDPEACSWYVCFCHCFSSRLNLLENLFFWPSKEKPHIPEPSYLQSINKCVRMCMIAISCEWLCFCYYADLLSCGMYPLARPLSLE